KTYRGEDIMVEDGEEVWSWNMVLSCEVNEFNIGDKVNFEYFTHYSRQEEYKRRTNAVITKIEQRNMGRRPRKRQRWDGVSVSRPKKYYLMLVDEIKEKKKKKKKEDDNDDNDNDNDNDDKEEKKDNAHVHPIPFNYWRNAHAHSERWIEPDQVVYRLEAAMPSKLFVFKSVPDCEVWAAGLMNSVSWMNWLVAFEIASFLAESYFRHIYFNCRAFDQIVQRQFCDMSLEAQKRGLRWQRLQFDDADICYRDRITHFPFEKHPTFPKADVVHQLYAKKPCLPLIAKRDRV
ncbi:hypothetical protein RFI_17724, partial [Reticulomyxa filosa]